MARPDIKQERREQILNAYETCVARYGVAGATLARTAEIAGLARPLLRHNVGNLEDLQAALVDRVLTRSDAMMDALIDSLPLENRLRTAIDWLFDPAYSDARLVQVSAALIAASADDPALAWQMRRWLTDFIARLEQLIVYEHHLADTARVSAVATGVAGIYFNVEALYPLGDTDAIVAASKAAALILIDSLETQP